ncbi:hypothetical protein [Hymenobacter koreensis]|uniref:Secreted protein n=1 Tax=Hymenobacter koreensis TaxID=1084523 RepID=A0ABP8J4G4_9BACT
MKKLLISFSLLLLSTLASHTAQAQMTVSTPGGNVTLPNTRPAAPQMPMMMHQAIVQTGTCVLTDSSRVSGSIDFEADDDGNLQLKVKTSDGQKLKYAYTQMAYLLMNKGRYIPVTDNSPEAFATFARVHTWGKLQAVQSGNTLLVRQQGTTSWVAVPAEGGPFENLKKLRAAVGPMVADQPAYAAALADGRITHNNLLQFIKSYNAYVTKQP